MNDPGYKWNLFGLRFRDLDSLLLFFLNGYECRNSNDAAIALAYRTQSVCAQHGFHDLIPRDVGNPNIHRHDAHRLIDDEIYAVLLRNKSQHVAEVHA